MEFWKFIVSLFNSILSSTFILRENRNWSEVLDSKLTIYGQDRWQLIIISFHNDVFTCYRAEVKTKEHKKRYNKTSNRYKLEKGSRLAALIVADLFKELDRNSC